MQCQPYQCRIVTRAGVGAVALGVWSGPCPCNCTHCHHYQFLDCNKKIWNLTVPLHSLIPIWLTGTPSEYYQNLKTHVRGQSISLFSSHQNTPKHWCFEVLCLCLNVCMLGNPAEISGTLSTERNLFCNSFLNVIPNPCCLQNFFFRSYLGQFFMLANAL